MAAICHAKGHWRGVKQESIMGKYLRLFSLNNHDSGLSGYAGVEVEKDQDFCHEGRVSVNTFPGLCSGGFFFKNSLW
jgi:hypothetical protein